MKVTLAVPRDGVKADETIEVDDALGAQLINEGRARAVQLPASKMTKAEKDAAEVRKAVQAKADESAATILTTVNEPAPAAPATGDDKAGK